MVNYKKIGKLLIWRCRQRKQLGGQLPPATMAANQEIEEVPSILLPCTSCNRTFRPEALAKHSKVCEKTLMKKRKTFDSSKQRLQGTEVESFPSPPSAPSVKKSRGKEKVDLAKVIQAAKKPEPPTPVRPSDHDECPHCGRFFGPKAFERHTQFCKEQQLKLKSTPNNQEAKERLKVRTSYRGPLTNKVLNRDRYQPKRDPSPMTTEHRDEGHRSRGLTRNSSLRSSVRTRGSDTTPPPPLRRTMTQISANSRPLRRSKDSLDEGTLPHTNGQKQGMPRLVTREPPDKKVFPRVVRHVITTVLPKRFSLPDAEKYNPYLSAERQMMELFGGETNNKSPTILPEIPSSPLQSSPTSAFVKYRSPSIENLKEEGNNNPGRAEPSTGLRKPDNLSLSNLSLCSVVSIDSVDCNRNQARLDEFQRSFSAADAKPRVGRSKVNMKEMLYGGNGEPPGNLEACEAELLISMMEFEKMLKSSPSPSPHSSPTLCSSNAHNDSKQNNNETENQKNFKNLHQGSVDSAYSSLTRSSAGDGDTSQQELPSFCHECGSKYPVAAAKFCCNCGMRRIIL